MTETSPLPLDEKALELAEGAVLSFIDADHTQFERGKSDDELKPWFVKSVTSTAIAAYLAALSSNPPEDDGWIEWKGGGMPVDDYSLVDVELRKGIEVCGLVAGVLDAPVSWWEHTGKGVDIIAYRVVSA